MNWQEFSIAPDGTHHLDRGQPAYPQRFELVGKFHSPGLAPVRDGTGAYHIGPDGTATYSDRYHRTFGFYQEKAAVSDDTGWFHIGVKGDRLYDRRWAWCGNFQESRCVVRDINGEHFHITSDGTPAYRQRYAYAGDFRDGLAVVQRTDGLHTHITPTGTLQHQRWFWDLDVFHKGFARARDMSGWFHIDPQGIPAYDRRFAAIEPFYNGQSRVEDFEGGLWLINLSGEEIVQLRPPRNRDYFIEVSADLVSYWRSQTLSAAVELGIFDVLPALATDINSILPISRSERLLRALGELGYVYLSNKNRWELTEKGFILKQENNHSLAAAARMWGKEHYTAWTHLKYSLLSGKPGFDKQFGEPLFDWLARESKEITTYHQALSSYAKHDYAEVVELIDFGQHQTVLDVGGGSGELLWAIGRSHECQLILLERPEVITRVQPPPEIGDRVELVSGNIFAHRQVRADAIVLAKVLHDWDDSQAKLILARARENLQPSGYLYIIERVLESGAYDCGMLDLNMLVTTGGRERTLLEFQQLLKQTGWEMVRTIQLTSGLSVLLGH